MKSSTYTIRGMAPLLMHSDRLANPFDDIVTEIKTITGKKKKTKDDLLEIARLEFIGGMYYNPQAGVHIPGYNVFAALLKGAALRKLGAALKRGGVVREDEIALKYDGPRDPEKLFADKRFVDMRTIKNGPTSGRVVRCRPIFKNWELSFTLLFDERAIEGADLDMIVADTGAMIGLGDYRPRFGRFERAGAA